MKTLREFCDELEKEENVKATIIDTDDGGFKIYFGESISNSRVNELNAILLQKVYNDRGKDIDVSANDELMFDGYGVSEGDHLRYYQLFHNNIESRVSNENDEIFVKTVEKSKIFDMSSSIANILYLTECKEMLNRPFEHMFLNCRLKLNDKIYYGFFVTTFDDGTECLVTISPEKMKVGFDMVLKIINLNENKSNNDKSVTKQERKSLLNFYKAFLMFLNEPEVLLKDVTRTQSNLIRRVKNGKTPLPPSNSKIELTGKLLIYLNKIETYQNLQYTHKFWVRGHYMSLRIKERYPNLYSLSEIELRERGYYTKDGIIRVWIKPHIKGQGILINKQYEI